MPRLPALVVAAVLLPACAGERLHKSRMPESATTTGAVPVRGKPGGLVIDFDKTMASERMLRVRVYKTDPSTIEIRMRTTQTRAKCATEQRVYFGIEGLDPGTYRVVLVDNGERSRPITAVVPAGRPRLTGGSRSSYFGGGC